MNVYETHMERCRRQRNERHAKILIYGFALASWTLAVGVTAWDAGRDYGHREAVDARDKGIGECASNQAGRKGK